MKDGSNSAHRYTAGYLCWWNTVALRKKIQTQNFPKGLVKNRQVFPYKSPVSVRGQYTCKIFRSSELKANITDSRKRSCRNRLLSAACIRSDADIDITLSIIILLFFASVFVTCFWILQGIQYKHMNNAAKIYHQHDQVFIPKYFNVVLYIRSSVFVCRCFSICAFRISYLNF